MVVVEVDGNICLSKELNALQGASTREPKRADAENFKDARD